MGQPKSHSSKGGGIDNFNEIRFEDKIGDELLNIQAEKNMTTLVKNDQSTTVKANRSAGVTGNDSVSVGGDRSVSVTGNLSVTVKGKGSGTPHSKLDVTGQHHVSASDHIEITAPTYIKLSVGATFIEMLPGKITLEAQGGGRVVIDPNVFARSINESIMSLNENAKLQSSLGSTLFLDGNAFLHDTKGDQVLLDGNAGVKSNGDVVLDAANIQAKAKTEAKMMVNACSVAVSGAGVDTTGPAVNVTGSSGVTIAGSMIKIG